MFVPATHHTCCDIEPREYQHVEYLLGLTREMLSDSIILDEVALNSSLAAEHRFNQSIKLYLWSAFHTKKMQFKVIHRIQSPENLCNYPIIWVHANGWSF